MSVRIKNFAPDHWKGEERTVKTSVKKEVKKMRVESRTPATAHKQKGFTSERTAFVDEQDRFADKKSKGYEFLKQAVEPKVKTAIIKLENKEEKEKQEAAQ